MNWRHVYDNYPINREKIWLNNCGITPAGTHVIEAMTRFLNDFAQHGAHAAAADYGRVLRRIKAVLSTLLGCAPEELCLLHNTAEGMNVISRGLRFDPGDEIILLENEYPSNVYPWRHWGDKGVKLLTAPAAPTPDAFFEALLAMVTSRTRLITLSAVHWCTGMPLPLARIGELCRDRDIRFVVDGAQGVGMQPMDVRRMNIDFMAFSAWKWLMGPLGLGVLYIAEKRLTELDPVFVGTSSVVMDEVYLPYKSDFKPTADRFTFSTPSIGDWVYFLAALTYLEQIGFDKVRDRIFELAEYLKQRLRNIGFQVLSDRFPDHPTGIVVCEKPGVQSGPMVQRLAEQKVVAAERLGRIRFSPHIYLSEYQIDAAARSLSQACMGQMYAQSVRR
ncbi:MAG: aminotransferase class V-fold PLP-dependent enzyme [Desulfococcus multivorans]|jgi:selenocysteine lyase/cysteine desulfurase|uniref:aminotransferase class V-fold PLP-dependent enzyme n=1 Tax=Desulfococcus sp. TaxID=2025834 RepID=UPI002A3FECB7|nr:aminotransferase class V-fold PLP-dependent enzyme [Desulfococcus multivorans]